MKQPQIISEVMHQLVLNSPKDPYAQILRRCPFIQADMLRKGYMSLDDLTDEEIDRIIVLDLEDFDIEEIKKRRPPMSDPPSPQLPPKSITPSLRRRLPKSASSPSRAPTRPSKTQPIVPIRASSIVSYGTKAKSVASLPTPTSTNPSSRSR